MKQFHHSQTRAGVPTAYAWQQGCKCDDCHKAYNKRQAADRQRRKGASKSDMVARWKF